MARKHGPVAVSVISVGLPVVLLGVALVAGSLSSAQAYRGTDGYDRAHYVTAESHWGNGTISGPVRSGRRGLQVRLPRGTWIDCVRSCTETLRRQTVDFWQSNGNQAPDSGRGYLRWEFRY